MLEQLKKFDIFSGMDENDLQKIAGICVVEKLPKGVQVFKTGDPAEYLFMVNKGKIELRFNISYHNMSTEISLDEVFEGNTFGWSALTHPFRYTLSAFTAEDSELVQIKESDIKKICQENNRLGYILMNNIAKIIGQRFSAIQGILIQEIQQSLKQKERLS